MAELFGIKTINKQDIETKTFEIDTLDIGISRRRDRRVLSKKDDSENS